MYVDIIDTCRFFHWRWVYAVSKRNITFVLLCGFFFLLVCGEVGTFFSFLRYYMLKAVEIQGLSPGSHSIHPARDNCLSSTLFSLARIGVRFSFFLDKSIHQRTFRMKMTKFLNLSKIVVRSSIRIFCFVSYTPMQAPGYSNPLPFLFNRCSHCRNSLHPPASCKNWIQTVRLTYLSWCFVVNINHSLAAWTRLSTDLFVHA